MIDKSCSSHRKLVVERLDPDLPLGIHEPKRPGDVGWDMECMHETIIVPGEIVDVPVNARIALPDGIWCQIHNRSSMGRRGLYVDANIIDTGYRGPLFVQIRNMDTARVTLKAGERVGQLLFYHATAMWMVEGLVDANTARGEQGFGSTGL